MKRRILSLAILVSVSLASFASTDALQQKKQPRGGFVKELNLSDDQKKQMEVINEDFGKKIEAVKNSRITEEVQRKRIQKLREEKKEAVNKMLTPEQQAKFSEKGVRKEGDRKRDDNKDRRGERGNMKDHRQGNHMMGGMFKDLDLTDAQKEQMKALREKHGEERGKMGESYKEEFYKILTPEQQAKLKDKREGFDKNRKDRRGDIEKTNKLDEAGKAKYKELKENYETQKSAVEKSRIAPDMQKQKLQILKENFDKEKKALFEAVK